MRACLRMALGTGLALLLCLGGGLGQAEPPNTFVYADNGYVVLDPAHASLYRRNDERLITALFECLTVLDPATGKAAPGAATSWTQDADDHAWTFTLRKGATWSDGSPVTAGDFVRAWRRIMDPWTESRWSWIYRSIKDCASITDNSARAEGYSLLRRGLRSLKRSNPNGIPGSYINDILDETGVRPYLEGMRKRSIRRMLAWPADDVFPPEMTDEVVETLKKARSEHKDRWREAFKRLGKEGSGVHAPDDHTLVVSTVGDVPFLPELVARSAFAPVHASVDRHRDKAYHPINIVTNGPFVLGGRGARPPETQSDMRITSAVDLTRDPKYDGPNKPHFDRVMCWTDLTLQMSAASELDAIEDVRQFQRGKLDWVYCTWPEYPPKTRKTEAGTIHLRTEIANLEGWTVRKAPRVIFLRFRCDRAPFDNKDARRALALTIDRNRLIGHFWPEARPARRFVPPGIEGRVEGVTCPRPDTSGAKAAWSAVMTAWKAAHPDPDDPESEPWIQVSFGESPGQDDVARELIRGWKQALGIEPGTSIESDAHVRTVLRAGAYQAMVSDYRGFVNDPYGYLAPFHSEDADSGLGWRDEKYDALIEAARDPQAAIDAGEAWLAKVGPSLKKPLEAAAASQAGRLALRRAALAEAERRILDEYVIVPLLLRDEAVLAKPGIEGMESDAALRNPGFVGSLTHVRR